MAVDEMSPNGKFRDVYDQLGESLEEGDDVFIEEGPQLLREALQEPGFLDGIETEHAEDTYTRAKAMGRPGEHVIRYMEWPPEYALLPHEHHGRPCFEALVEGKLFLADMDVEEAEGDRYLLDVAGTTTCDPGETAVLDPRDGINVHAVYSPVRTKSLHVYPDDNYYSIGYVPADDSEKGQDFYRRKEFRLRDEAE